MAELAARHDVLVLSDEIHAPLSCSSGRSHVPFPLVDPRNVIALSSASKTFNLAGAEGLRHDRAERPDPGDRRPRRPELPITRGTSGSSLRAAFEHGEPWLAEVMRTLDRNRHLVAELLAKHLPGVKYALPEAGYLAWLDFRELGIPGRPREALPHEGEGRALGGPALRHQRGGLRSPQLRHVARDNSSRRPFRGWPPHSDPSHGCASSCSSAKRRAGSMATPPPTA